MAILPSEDPRRRASFALVGSLVANVLLWFCLSLATSRVVVPRDPPVLEFERVTIDNKGVTKPKIVKPKEIQKKIQQIVRQPPPQARHTPPPPPQQGAHNRVLTAQNKLPGAKPEDTALDRGNLRPGTPVPSQSPGDATTPPSSTPPPAAPVTQSNQTAPPVQKQPDPPATPPVTPTPPPPPPPPPPVEQAKPKGPTADATPVHQEDVEIPDSLKDQSFKSFVRVRVNIAADGSFVVVLRTTSGNDQIDKLVLDSLKRWKWKAAVKDGEQVDSVQLFRFDFEVK